MLEELFRQVDWFCPKDNSIMKPLGYVIGDRGDYLLIKVYCSKCCKRIELKWYFATDTAIRRKNA